MTKLQKLIYIGLFILLIIGFIIFLFYRPDQKVESSAIVVYQSYNYTDISDFFPDEKGVQLLQYTNLNIAYSEHHEQAIWVCYLLTRNQLAEPVCKRSNYFKTDPNVYSKSSALSDYYKSGYDRGHLAPAADMLWSEVAMKESFYMSNMSPQNPQFNRGAWKKLEGRIRKVAVLEDSLIIITGPILHDSLSTIGENEVSIPEQYYKIVIDISAPHLGAVAFLMPNRNTKLSLDKFVLSVDSLEVLVGMDFMTSLPDDLEEQLEYRIDEVIFNKLIY